MTISELIRILKHAKKEYGDITVKIESSDYEYSPQDISKYQNVILDEKGKATTFIIES